MSRSTESTKLVLNNQVDTFFSGQWQSCPGPEVQNPTRWLPVALWPQLFTQYPPTSNNPLRSQEIRVWEQNPTPSRSSQGYIALLRLKKRGEGNVRANKTPDRTQHRRRARGLWVRSKWASDCRKKKDGNERIVEEMRSMRRPCQEHERNGERRKETGGYQKHPLCKLQMKSPGPILPSPSFTEP